MCSVNDEDGVNDLMKESEVLTKIGSSCRKCETNVSEVVLRGKDPYCRECFLVNATHKFRASLGKSKMVRKGDKVLMAFSGSASSMALLHLVDAGFKKQTHKRLMFEPLVVYIEEGGVYDAIFEERKQNVKDVTNRLKQFDLPSCISSLDLLFKTIENEIVYDINSEFLVSPNSQLTDLFRSVKSQTSRFDLLAKLRNNLLLKIALNTGCCKIITAETLVDTAVKLLSNISLGRGLQLPLDIGFCDSRDKNVNILRPLQDFEPEEINFYNKIHEMESIDVRPDTFNSSKNGCIQMLTRHFVNDLQDNFPSTVSTVYRTGAKLNADIENKQSSESCSLCKGPLDTEFIASSSLQATMYSSLLSTRGPSYNKNGEQTEEACCNGKTDKIQLDADCSGGCGEKCSNKPTASGNPNTLTALCYGCRLIANDLGSINSLPEDVRSSIIQNSMLHRMKDEIKDFLL